MLVGRRDERTRFAALLNEVPTGRRSRMLPSRRHRATTDHTVAVTSRVVLVHGLGGSGKSSLLQYFRGMADGTAPDSPVPPGRIRTAWLDWEDELRDQPSRYADIEGPSLVTVLDALRAAVIDTTDNDARAFDDYLQGAARMPEYAAKFAEVLAQSHQPESPFTQQDAAALVKSAVSAGLTIAGHPGGLAGLTPDQLAKSATAAGHLSAAATRAVTGKKPGDLPPGEYDLVTDPARELARRLATAIREVAARTSLVVLLDTGEVIGLRAWSWLRRVMTQTGPRVTWVIGARFETEAEAGVDSPVAQFIRDIGDERLLLMSPTRFDDSMIRDYLAIRTPDRTYTDAEIDLIARFTKGLPLAVSLSAKLLEEGQTAEHVCRETDDGHPSNVVSQLARRYLIHAERTYPDDDPRRDDVAKILSLALVSGDLRSDPELLTALWNVSDPLAAFLDLARRHDFVLPVSRRLHDDVRDAVRTDLLDPYRRVRAQAGNQRALDLFAARLAKMRERWPTLDEQLGHSHYTTTLLACLWHTLWLDNQAGLDLFIDILPVLAAFDRATAYAAASVIETFAGTFDDDQSRELALFTEMIGWSPFPRPADMKPILPRGALQRADQSKTDYWVGDTTDHKIALLTLKARLQVADHEDDDAVATLRTAADLAQGVRLRQEIGSQARLIVNRLIWAAPGRPAAPTPAGLVATRIVTEIRNDDALAWYNYATALQEDGSLDKALVAHDRAIALDTNNSRFHNNRGIVLARLGRLGDAVVSYDRAIALDPANGQAHNNRGVVLTRLGRLADAVASHDRAIALDPSKGGRHENRGIALAVQGELGDALAEFDLAEQLDPEHTGEARIWAGAILWQRGDSAGARDRFARTGNRIVGCTPFHTVVLETIAQCGTGQVDTQRLQNALDLRVVGDRVEPRALYDLLSDPPLPGIEAIRRIVESE